MKRLNALAVFALAGTVAAAPAPDLVKGKKIVDQICAACHATDGNSAIPTYPKIAGQHLEFIIKQTHDIKDGKRTTGSAAAMMPMVQGLSDEDIRNVAAYYNKQTSKPGESSPKEQDNVKLGERIYRGGLAEKKIPACMSCHGPSGAGIPGGGTEIAGYPRVSGQHASYVVEQLKAYAADQRTGNMMRDIAKRLNEEEMKAVGNFIQGLH